MEAQEPQQARDPAGPRREDGPSGSSNRLLLVVLALAAFVSVLNTSMVNVAIPLIGQDLDVSGADVGWIVTGYALVFAIGLPIYGRISDSFSLRGTFSLALVVFAAGSLVCALAPSFWVLVAGRALQAAGSAAVPALALGSIAGVRTILGFLTDIKNGQEEEVSPDLENLLGRRPASLEEGLKVLFGL